MSKNNSQMDVVFNMDSPSRLVFNLVVTALLAALSLVAYNAAQGEVIDAASPSLTDVTAAIHSAADGDTVTIPKGTATWTSTVKISKGITLIGQTTTDPVHKTADDRTIISVNTGANGNTPLLVVESASRKSYRVSGITFRTGRTGVVNSNGLIQLRGGSHAVRVDHCHFDDLPYENNYIAVWGPIRGVIDHNLFDFRSGNNHAQTIFVNGGDNGDAQWALSAGFGSDRFIFVEDNCLNNTNGHEFAGTTDDQRGGRWVFRHNHVYDCGVGSHGNEIGRERGGRAVEVYNNDFHWTMPRNIGGIRSGAFITHDNTHDGVQPQRGETLGQYRMFIDNNKVFGGSTGDNPWDHNATEPDGSHIDGHPPYLFESGTAAAGSERTRIVDTKKKWPPNRWRGYTAKRVSDGRLALIDSNTSTTLTVLYHDGYGGGVTWNSDDQYQIHRVLISLDQPCRGGGDLITGSPPINSRTGTAEWPRQLLEPAYSWKDVYTPTGTRVNIELATGAGAILQEGRDFFNNTPMPGYTPFTYPHPLTVSLPPSQLSPSSKRHLSKNGERTDKKVKIWKWGKAKEKPANKTAK